MKLASSQDRSSDLQARVALIEAAADGKFAALHCPQCGHNAVEVFFTCRDGEYLTWFECGDCDLSMRAQNSSKPQHYEEARDRSVKQGT